MSDACWRYCVINVLKFDCEYFFSAVGLRFVTLVCDPSICENISFSVSYELLFSIIFQK